MVIVKIIIIFKNLICFIYLMLSGTRQIKSNKNTDNNSVEIIKINPKEGIMHPTTLDGKLNTHQDKSIAITNYYIDNNEKIRNTKEEKLLSEKEIKERDYSKYKEAIKISNLTFDSESLIGIYLEDTTSPSELNDYINKSIDEVINLNTINRVINLWLWNNIKILKSHNNFLETIYYDLITKYNKDLINDNLKKNIKQYVDYWTEHKTENDFDFDLYNDLINHLKKL